MTWFHCREGCEGSFSFDALLGPVGLLGQATFWPCTAAMNPSTTSSRQSRAAFPSSRWRRQSETLSPRLQKFSREPLQAWPRGIFFCYLLREKMAEPPQKGILDYEGSINCPPFGGTKTPLHWPSSSSFGRVPGARSSRPWSVSPVYHVGGKCSDCFWPTHSSEFCLAFSGCCLLPCRRMTAPCWRSRRSRKLQGWTWRTAMECKRGEPWAASRLIASVTAVGDLHGIRSELRIQSSRLRQQEDPLRRLGGIRSLIKLRF